MNRDVEQLRDIIRFTQVLLGVRSADHFHTDRMFKCLRSRRRSCLVLKQKQIPVTHATHVSLRLTNLTRYLSFHVHLVYAEQIRFGPRQIIPCGTAAVQPLAARLRSRGSARLALRLVPAPQIFWGAAFFFKELRLVSAAQVVFSGAFFKRAASYPHRKLRCSVIKFQEFFRLHVETVRSRHHHVFGRN